jgi:hypothetical protein
MDNFESQSPTQPATNNLQAQFDTLRHLVVSMLILVVVISGTLNIYLLRQWRSTSKDLTAIRPQAAAMINDYQKSQPLMNDFLKKVTDYAQGHPDFVPILSKYGIKPSAPTPLPAGAKLPTPPVVPKK